jgi:hypothetical protein
MEGEMNVFELVVMTLMAAGLYVFYRVIMKEPIIPWKEKKVAETTGAASKGKKKKSNNKHSVPIEEEPVPFRNLFEDIKEISHNMIRYHDNKFVLLAEVEPVNYFLLSQDEQEGIDVTFETWLATLNYPSQWYLQSRYIDLTEPIESMQSNMAQADDLSEITLEYGRTMIRDIYQWQGMAPRFETKRYLVLYYECNAGDITADDEEELNERIIDKSWSELYRRYMNARNSLRKADMKVEMLTNEGIGEVLYHAFNRRKALKNRFKDIAEKEKLSLYVTTDQDDRRVERVKEMINHENNEEKEAI